MKFLGALILLTALIVLIEYENFLAAITMSILGAQVWSAE